MRILGDVACFSKDMYVCLIREGDNYVPIEELKIGESYPLAIETLFTANTETTGGTGKLITESSRPNANLYVELEINGSKRFAQVAGDITIFNRLKEAGLGTIFISNRPFNVPEDQILVKGMSYDSVKRINPKLKNMLDNVIMSDDGFWVSLSDEDMKLHNEYLKECVTHIDHK